MKPHTNDELVSMHRNHGSTNTFKAICEIANTSEHKEPDIRSLIDLHLEVQTAVSLISKICLKMGIDPKSVDMGGLNDLLHIDMSGCNSVLEAVVRHIAHMQETYK